MEKNSHHTLQYSAMTNSSSHFQTSSILRLHAKNFLNCRFLHLTTTPGEREHELRDTAETTRVQRAGHWNKVPHRY